LQQEEIIAFLDFVEEKMMNADTLGFSPDVLAVLGNVEAGNEEIEMLKFRIDQEILIKIFNIANSAYYGTLNKGAVHTFYEVVTRLGMSHTKALIILLALQLLARGDEEVEAVFACSFASSVLGKLLAQQMGLREDAAKRVELGGLFSEIGKMIMIIYKKLHAADDDSIDDVFIEKYSPYLAERIIDVFSLPDYLKTMVFQKGLGVEAGHITLPGIVRLAISFIRESFKKHRNRLLVEPLAVPIGFDRRMSLEYIIQEQFNAVGLGRYLTIGRGEKRLLPARESLKRDERLP
jgi:hypothetical protein